MWVSAPKLCCWSELVFHFFYPRPVKDRSTGSDILPQQLLQENIVGCFWLIFSVLLDLFWIFLFSTFFLLFLLFVLTLRLKL